jgi:hypothetical protein
MLAAFLGRPADAAAHFEAAVSLARTAGLRPHLAQLLYQMSRFLRSAAPPDLARADALAAEARQIADDLDLRLLRRRLSQSPVPVSPAKKQERAPQFTLHREGDYWSVAVGSDVCRIKDGRGIQMLAELCSHPGREFHVLTLMGSDDAADGDAGALLDDEAIADYRARVAELDEELAEADSWADPARAAKARAERDAIAAELARAVGLGGRERRAGNAAERARTNVQRRIRGTIRKIAESLPGLGAYLERAVKTGTFCSYEPY